jgi:hypothetical protein
MLCLPWRIDPLGRTSKWENFPVAHLEELLSEPSGTPTMTSFTVNTMVPTIMGNMKMVVLERPVDLDDSYRLLRFQVTTKAGVWMW